MKKLLIATMVVALAAGAWAEATFSETKVSFDESGTETGRLIPEESTTSGQWECADTEASLTITAYGDDTKYSYSGTGNTRAFSDEQTNYLNIDTGSGKPLWRKFASDGSGVDIGDGYVFDALVQFTGAEEAPAVLDDDKLVIWMQSVDDDDGNKTSTLNVTTRKTDGEGFPLGDDVNVKLDVTVTEGAWYRLSIKSFMCGTSFGECAFAVFVDGVAVKTSEAVYNEADIDYYSGGQGSMSAQMLSYLKDQKLIPSRIMPENSSTLTQVGFEGSGKIDDIQIVTAADAPDFTKDTTPAAETFTVTFAQKGLPDGTAWTAPDTQQIESGKTITSLPNIQVVEGYTASAWQYDNGTAYEAQEITGAVTLYVTYTVVAKDPDPIAPGVASATFTTEEAAKAYAENPTKYLTAPDVFNEATDAEKIAAYKAFFTGTVTGRGSEWTVTFDIAESAKTTLQDTADTVVLKVLDSTGTIKNAQPGFYYAILKSVDSLTGTYTATDWVQADADGNVSINAPEATEGATAEFYKIGVKAYLPAEQ